MHHIKPIIGFLGLTIFVYAIIGVFSYLSGYSFSKDAQWFYTLITLVAMDTNFLFEGAFNE